MGRSSGWPMHRPRALDNSGRTVIFTVDEHREKEIRISSTGLAGGTVLLRRNTITRRGRGDQIQNRIK